MYSDRRPLGRYQRRAESLTVPHAFDLDLVARIQPRDDEKRLLAAAELTRPIDIFDLLLHGTPWILLLLKLALMRSARGPG